MHEEEGMLQEALRAGGDGYVVKRADEPEILRAIHAVRQGKLYVHATMTRALAHPPAQRERQPAPAEALTHREVDVLRLLARGNTNRQIAELLNLSIRTVESHRANLMGKLGLASRVELVTYAEENALL
jgi:two-component system, NarL family, response regulator NreC